MWPVLKSSDLFTFAMPKSVHQDYFSYLLLSFLPFLYMTNVLGPGYFCIIYLER
jgi:hypothetical protein